MVNNNYNYQGKDYAIGGLINGEIDGVTLTGGEETDIYEIELETGHKIALSSKYGLFILLPSKMYASYNVTGIKIGDCAYIKDNPLSEKHKISSITKRKGKNINIPKQHFILNGFYVGTVFQDRSPDITIDVQNRDNCVHRSKEMIQHTITSCCSTHERHDYFCEAKKIYLTQPICYNCEQYKKKD